MCEGERRVAALGGSHGQQTVSSLQSQLLADESVHDLFWPSGHDRRVGVRSGQSPELRRSRNRAGLLGHLQILDTSQLQWIPHSVTFPG